MHLAQLRTNTTKIKLSLFTSFKLHSNLHSRKAVGFSDNKNVTLEFMVEFVHLVKFEKKSLMC